MTRELSQAAHPQGRLYFDSWRVMHTLFSPALWLALLLLTACSSDDEAKKSVVKETPQISQQHSHVWVNGEFENDNIGAVPTGWTVQNFQNNGIISTLPSPQTFASLQTGTVGTSQPWTFVVGGALESQIDPDLGAGASLRFPRYGIRAARVNYLNTSNKGSGRNANVLSQTMTTTIGDVDPTDDKIHVRFALAPVLENPLHPYEQQPYYYVELTNLTTGQTLYQDFNISGQVGVPWKSNGAVSTYLYTDWQLVDIAPGNTGIRVGDQLILRVVGAGCSQSGHWGRVYLDAVGSGVPGLFAWMTGVQSVNANSNLTYTVNYKNGGNATTNGTKLDFVTPPNTKFVSVSTPGACTAPAVGATGTVSCTLGSLTQGTVGSYTITVSVDNVATGTVITNGNYNIYATGVTALLGPKVQSTVTNGVTYANVGVTKSDGVAALTWGAATDYTITVTNAGPNAANTVTVADTVPAQLTGVTWTCATSGGATCTASGTGNINDTAVSIPVGGVATYTVHANVIAGSGTSSVSNSVTATVGGTETDSDTRDNSSIDINSIGSLRTLTFTKSAGTNGGTVNSTPSSINCGTSCAADSGSFIDGTQVILTASPVNGSSFLGWGGACAAAGTATTCTLTMSADQTVSASFTPAASIAVNGGSGQATLRSSAFGTSLSALVLDAGGSPLAGATVYFVAPASGASATLSAPSAVTNASGIATVTATANGTSGSYNVTASSASAVGTATFALSNYGPASTVGVAAGNSQSTTVLTAYGTALTAVVRDSQGVAVPGVTVSFAAPGSGASASLSASSAVTDSSGRASITATANGTAGTFSVTASAAGAGTTGTFSLTNLAGSPASVAVNGGGTQSTTIGTAFGTALSAIVRDAQNNPVAGVTVTFTAPGSGARATLSASTATTNALGVASVTATAGNIAGSYTVSASVSGVGAPISFNLTNNAGAPASITMSSGTSQSTTVNTAFGSALVALVLDAQGNAVSGATVSFAVPGSGASATRSANTATTNASGLASITVTANSVAGSYLATASVAGVGTPASFALTNTAGAPASISVTAGSAQSTVVSTGFATQLVATVRDASNNLVSGALVTFSGPGASVAGANLSSTTATTNGSGVATVSASANTVAGTYTVAASVSGVATPANFTLTNTPGAAASLVATSGGGQSATVNTAFAAPLVTTVLDAFGNPVPGVTVSLSTPASTGPTAALGAASGLSNASGQVSISATAGQRAGGYNVTASLSNPAVSVTFALTNTAGAVGSIRVGSGSPQSAVVDTPFGAPLQVGVFDAFDNPLSGVLVTFSAPVSGSSATLSSTTATTGPGGTTSVTARAGTVAGSYSVTASAAGAAPTTFALTNTAGAPARIETTQGSGQTAAVQTAFSAPLVATVFDAFDNVVPGVSVAFAGPGSGASASFSPATVVSNALGTVSTTASANSTAGNFSVTASYGGGAGSTTFALTNSAGAVGSMVLLSGSPQNATVHDPFTGVLRVAVLDSFGNRVPGSTVSFSAPSSGASASLSASSVVTDGAGEAFVSATANEVAGSYVVTASATGAAAPISFNLTNDPGAAAAIEVVTGSGQSATVQTPFSGALVVRVRDADGNTVPSANVTFSVPASGATATLNVSSLATDGSGLASVSPTAGAVTGAYSVTAQIGTGAQTSFTLTNTAGAVGSIVVSSGNNQSAAVTEAYGAPLVFTVLDALGNPVPGASVSISVPSSGPTGTPDTSTLTTNGTGQASVQITAGTSAGSFVVSASATGAATPAQITLTNTHGAATTLTAQSGGGQSATILTPFAQQLEVLLVDAYGNPVPGATVGFSAPSSGPSGDLSASSAVTDAQGVATIAVVANRTTGSYVVSANVSGLANGATFALTNTAGAVGSISIVDGNTQETEVDTSFGLPLTVLVQDAEGNAVPGVAVTFSAPTSGASATLSASSAITLPDGTATITATANTLRGSYTVSGSAPGAAVPVLFNLTNLSSGVATLHIASGDEQSTIVGTPFPAALRVTARDRFDNLVPNVNVTFGAPSSGASATLSSAAATSDAQGEVSITAVANSVTGTFQVQASATGAAAITFNLRNIASAPTSITVVAGGTQSTIVNTAFPSALRVVVRDASSNVVPGAEVKFATATTGASATLSTTSVITDANGEASTLATANTIAGKHVATATVGALANATFDLENKVGAAAKLSASGSGQSARVREPFPTPIRVLVFDQYDNIIPGVAVTFAVPDSGASAVLSAPNAVTDAEGSVQVSAIANELPGKYQVVATLNDLSIAIDLTNIEDKCTVDPDDVACPLGDRDKDGVPNGEDPDASDPCVPNADHEACGDGDSDGDGVPNSVECPDPKSCADVDHDGLPDFNDPDSDGDGISDADECPEQSSEQATCADADGDGIPDFLESNVIDSDADGKVDALDADADNDGVPDGEESNVRPWPDLDGDGIPSHLDSQEEGPGAGDNDGDGLPDDWECPSGYICRDLDKDGIPDYADKDSDGDGLSDKKECPSVDACPDVDGDGKPDALEPNKITAKGGACSASPTQTPDLSWLVLLGLLGATLYRRHVTYTAKKGGAVR